MLIKNKKEFAYEVITVIAIAVLIFFTYLLFYGNI